MRDATAALLLAASIGLIPVRAAQAIGSGVLEMQSSVGSQVAQATTLPSAEGVAPSTPPSGTANEGRVRIPPATTRPSSESEALYMPDTPTPTPRGPASGDTLPGGALSGTGSGTSPSISPGSGSPDSRDTGTRGRIGDNPAGQ